MLQMFAFFMALILFGGITSLAVVVDKYAARRAPYPFAAFFAGLISLALVLGFFLLAEALEKNGVRINHFVGSILLFATPLVSLIGGAIFGYRLGINYKRKYAHLWE